MPESVLIERALWVIAICMAIQTGGTVVTWIVALVAWRRAHAYLERIQAVIDVEMSDMRARLDRVSDGIEQAALTLNRSAAAIHDTVADTTQALKSAAAIVTAPRAAVALGVWRGLQWFRRLRNRRQARPPAPRLAFQHRP